MRAIVRAITGAVAVVVAIPLVMTLVYAFVEPVSLPVLRHKAAGIPVRQVFVPLEAIAPEAVRAVVMAEDARFCFHWGVDLNQAAIVMQEAIDGAPSRGASTITMQTVKNLFLWPGRSYLRKALELPLALWMDLVLSKDRILEIYLNIAQWGPGVFGIEGASQLYFGHSAAELSRPQALALATMLPAPAARNPNAPGPRQRAAIAHVTRELARAPWVFSCLPAAIRP